MVYTKEQIAVVGGMEEKLTRSYGSHTLAFFGLASENYHFLTPDGEGLINYRLSGKVAVVLGDPVCSPLAIERVLRSFLAFCKQHKWHVAFYQVYPQYLPIYRSLNLHAFKMGEEAMLNPQNFTLSGSALANVRTSSRRAQREGIRIHWYEGIPPTEVMQQLQHISNNWLQYKPGKRAAETGFSVGKFAELPDLAQRADHVAMFPVPSTVPLRTIPRFLTAVAMTTANNACAFMTFTPIYGYLNDNTADDEPTVQGWGWTLDMMRRGPDAPPGVIELLLVNALENFRSAGALALSLGLVAWADTNREMAPLQRILTTFISDRLHLLEAHHTLFKFKQKFHPHWQSRYIVTHANLALPKVALAVFHVRNYSGRNDAL